VPQLEYLNVQDMWFQQDGTLAHFVVPGLKYVNEMYPDRWMTFISTSVEWLTSSPGVSPCDRCS